VVARTFGASHERIAAKEVPDFALEKARAARQAELASVIDRLRAGPLTDREFPEVLWRLFLATDCLEARESLALCKADLAPTPLDRTLAVRALDLLIALFPPG